MASASVSLVIGESVLALTPIVIKTTKVDHLTSVWSRILTAAVVGFLVSGERFLTPAEYGVSTVLGYTNLLHVVSSYEAFRNLPAGQAMSIFYTYPLWILGLNSLINGESFTQKDYGCIGVASLGSALVNYNPGRSVAPAHDTPEPMWGIFASLLAAFTEATMHALLRNTGWRDAGKSVWVVSGGSAVWLLGIIGVLFLSGSEYPVVRGTVSQIGSITAFHGLSTFIGYYLRFFAVPRLGTITYSILSYSGLLASYVYGFVFLGERPGVVSLLGAALILFSGIYLVL